MKDQAYQLRLKMLQSTNSPAKSIAVVSGKGGVGKSNFSTNLSILIGKENAKVLLFDLDIGMGNIHILLGSHAEYSIMDYLESPEIRIDEIIAKDVHGISYISGGNGLQDIIDWQQEKIDRFLTAMDYLTLEYDYIVFDMGAGATQQTLEFLMTMDKILVVTTPEPTSLTDAYSMIKYIHKRNENKNFFLVCNRAESKKEGIETINRLRTTTSKFLNKDIASLGFLPEDPTVKKAVSQQCPFVIGYPKSPVSLSLQSIAENLITGKVKDSEKNEKEPFIKQLRNLFFGR
jgi:flagellar biosynthesis protein FlhG